jgi:hypothetical protein
MREFELTDEQKAEQAADAERGKREAKKKAEAEGKKAEGKKLKAPEENKWPRSLLLKSTRR